MRPLAVVPAFNEAGEIEKVLEEVRATDRELPVLAVDDGSTDDTAGSAQRAGPAVPRLLAVLERRDADMVIGSRFLGESWYRLLLFVTWITGAVTPLTTLLIFSMLFLPAIVVHYAVITSRLTTQMKNLTQPAWLSARVDRIDGI